MGAVAEDKICSRIDDGVGKCGQVAAFFAGIQLGPGGNVLSTGPLGTAVKRGR